MLETSFSLEQPKVKKSLHLPPPPKNHLNVLIIWSDISIWACSSNAAPCPSSAHSSYLQQKGASFFLLILQKGEGITGMACLSNIPYLFWQSSWVCLRQCRSQNSDVFSCCAQGTIVSCKFWRCANTEIALSDEWCQLHKHKTYPCVSFLFC